MVNSLGHCWECNQPGQGRINCPDLVQSRTSYWRGQDQDEDVRCLLSKRTRKELRSQVFEEDVERIFWEAMTENNWKSEDFEVEETKEERFISSSIDVVHSESVKPGKNHLLHKVRYSQHRVNNLNHWQASR